jgi:hypothetical protein
MAFSLLENEGFALPWMEDRKEIEKELKAAQKVLKRTWDWRKLRLENGDNSPVVEQEWYKAQAAFSAAVTKLNKRIDSYNTQIPSDVFYRPRIVIARELGQVKQ